MLITSKYKLVAEALLPEVKTVLDVGCRDGILKSHIPSNLKYTGIDICDGPMVNKVCDVEKGIPFEDSSFDTVVALDLLEHTNNIFFVFDELVRVARKQVIIILPNIYHWRLRVRFLFGFEMGKYILPKEPIVDRHRWLTSYNSIERFSKHMAQKFSLRLQSKVIYGGRRTILIDRTLSLFSKNLGAWAGMFIFERVGANKPSTDFHA